MRLFTALAGAFAAFTMTAPANAEEACEPVPGWEEVLENEQVQFLVIGEMHGTAETPDLFADLVCLTGSEAPVTVALEQPDSAQEAIDRFLQSDGQEEAQSRFLASSIWTNTFKDGRSSQAMFAMFESLRRLHQSGLVSKVVAFVPTNRTDISSIQEYEQTLAENISAAASGERVLVHIGNVHAMRQEVDFSGTYMPMAGLLPADATMSFDTTGNGGEAWACTGMTVAECGPMSLGTNPDPQERHVSMATSPDNERFSGVIFLGTTTTASPPRVAEEETQ